MIYDCEARLRAKEIDVLASATGVREIQFLGVRLVDQQCKYDPEAVANHAIRKGLASRLGYLTEVSLEAAENLGLTGNLDRPRRLADVLYARRNAETVFLPQADRRGRRNDVLSRLAERRSGHPLNEKWKVCSAIHASEIEEYIDLYLRDLRQGTRVKICRFDHCREAIERRFREFMELVYES